MTFLTCNKELGNGLKEIRLRKRTKMQKKKKKLRKKLKIFPKAKK